VNLTLVSQVAVVFQFSNTCSALGIIKFKMLVLGVKQPGLNHNRILGGELG